MRKVQKQTVVSALCALIAVVAVFAYTATIKSEALTQRAEALEHYGGERVQVVVASQDIEVGQALTQSNTQLADWVVDLLPAGDVAKAQADVDGRVAQTNIKKNEPVLLERVGDGSSRISVPDGLEAVTVSSDDVLAVGGAIRAGSLVDVYVETSASKVVLLGQKILVLETNGGASNENADKQVSWVTLAVTPESTSELLTASVKGTIHLVLPSSTAAKKGGK